MTETLRQGVRQVCDELEVAAQVTGLGSLFGIHLTDQPVRNYRDIAAGNSGLRGQVFLGLLNEGVLVAPNLVGALSTAITKIEMDAFVDTFKRVLERQR